jgi:hypothetical protein
MKALHVLLGNSIDYAGLFPPAALDMGSAVVNYGSYQTGQGSWALGRFVLPVSRFPEFSAATASQIRSRSADKPWPLAALGGSDLTLDLDTIAAFNGRERTTRVDTLELKADSVAALEHTMHLVPDHLQAYIEIPVDRDPTALLTAMADLGARAKVRTGGVTPEGFPRTSDLIRFLVSCIRIGVPFKATAGLHHPLRAEYRLTYAPDSPRALMFGFLNLFLAAAFLRAGMDERQGAEILEESSPNALQVDPGGIDWRGHRLNLDDLRRAREVIISFGSCSFTEPLSELQTLHLEPRVHQA